MSTKNASNASREARADEPREDLALERDSDASGKQVDHVGPGRRARVDESRTARLRLLGECRDSTPAVDPDGSVPRGRAHPGKRDRRQPARGGVRVEELAKGDVEEGVAVQDEVRPVAEEGRRVFQCAAGPERLSLDGIRDGQAEGPPVTDGLGDQVRSVARAEHDVVDAGASHLPEDVLDERVPRNIGQRLGPAVHHGSEPRAEPAREDRRATGPRDGEG